MTDLAQPAQPDFAVAAPDKVWVGNFTCIASEKAGCFWPW